MEKIDYTRLNGEIWDNIGDSLAGWTKVISHEDFEKAKNGALDVTLAGFRKVPMEWFPELNGSKVLALACGGGQQCPVFAAHGADVTVTDISDGQLENERFAADRENYRINIVKTDLSKPFPFEDGYFDMIFNPISNCYIEDITVTQRECARVIRKNGVLMTAFIKEEFFMFEPDFKNEDVLISRHSLPFNSLKDISDEERKRRIDNKMPLCFSHTLTEQIGGLIKAGFEITDIFEDGDGQGLFDKYMNPYVAVRAVKK